MSPYPRSSAWLKSIWKTSRSFLTKAVSSERTCKKQDSVVSNSRREIVGSNVDHSELKSGRDIALVRGKLDSLRCIRGIKAVVKKLQIPIGYSESSRENISGRGSPRVVFIRMPELTVGDSPMLPRYSVEEGSIHSSFHPSYWDGTLKGVSTINYCRDK